MDGCCARGYAGTVSKYPASRTRGLRQMQTLQEGEDSRTYRVRAPEAVHEWLSGMSAEERGQMLTTACQLDLGRPNAPREWPEPIRETMERLEARFTTPRKSPRASRGLEGVSVLHVASAQVPQRLKNRLRWSPERYAALETTLGSESVLRLERVNGKTVWHTSEGKPIRRDTVQRLFEVGVLTAAVSSQDDEAGADAVG